MTLKEKIFTLKNIKNTFTDDELKSIPDGAKLKCAVCNILDILIQEAEEEQKDNEELMTQFGKQPLIYVKKEEPKEIHIHQKVFSDKVLMSNPPQYQWICSICGEKGVDKGTFYNTETYDDIVKRFEKWNMSD